MRLTCTLLFCLSFAASAQQPTRVPLENEYVKVLDVTSQPGEKTRLHEHKVNRVMVYLNEGTQHFEWQGGKPTELKWKAGQPLWSPAAGMHTAEITSKKPVRIIEIELKKPAGGKSATGPLDPVKIDTRHYKVEFENDQVRVVRARIGPGESTPQHEHKLNRVVVYLSDQKFKVISADGKVDMPVHKSGDVSWGPPAKHTETNINDKMFDVIVIEIKS